MSFFPILSAPSCTGRTTLFNFPPNNFEYLSRRPQFVNLTWSTGEIWQSICIDELPYGTSRSYTLHDLPINIPKGRAPFLSLTNSLLPETSETLPPSPPLTQLPHWRATLELLTSKASTSYQGEIDPFPDSGSLLSFPPLIQCNSMINNFLLFMNLEKSPGIRSGKLEIYKSSDRSNLIEASSVLSNSITCISLDSLDLRETDLPVLISRNMSGIPLFLAISDTCNSMSLEHTHPPASYVIHGRRWAVQKYLKGLWYDFSNNK